MEGSWENKKEISDWIYTLVPAFISTEIILYLRRFGICSTRAILERFEVYSI
jgi:hypothetical protein